MTDAAQLGIRPTNAAAASPSTGTSLNMRAMDFSPTASMITFITSENININIDASVDQLDELSEKIRLLLTSVNE